MKSYASVGEIEDRLAVCEVELIPIEDSRSEDFASKETDIMDIDIELIVQVTSQINEGDILVVEHDGQNVSHVYYKDDEEKARRIEIIQAILNA